MECKQIGTLTDGVKRYELSPKMKKHITQGNDKYTVGEKNLKLNRDIAVSKTTREGCTRADSSDYISPDFADNQQLKLNQDLTNYRIRKLTPLECLRLMGFDDEDYEKVRAIGMSDSQIYKQAGNSIVVNVLEKIFEKTI